MKPDRAISVQSAGVCARQEASHRIPDAVAGSVIVPPELAGVVLRALVRALAERVRTDGGTPSPACRVLLAELHEATRRPVADVGNEEPPPVSLDLVTGMVTVAQLAEESGHSPRTLRHWAAGGRLVARRVGRTWLVDPDSLRGMNGTEDLPSDRT
jgi:hypothetical protein